MKQEQIFERLSAWLLRRNTVTAVRRVGDLPIALATDIGSVRQENQDKIAVMRGDDSSGCQYVVSALSDGMGGMQDGAVCAALTLAAFLSDFFVRAAAGTASVSDNLAAAAFHANSIVHARYRGEGGATLSAVVWGAEDPIHLLNIGDSRIHVITDGELMQLTVDDTLDGQLAHREGSAPSGRNELLQYVGIGGVLVPHITNFSAPPNSRVLITSDGAHYLDAALIGKIAGHASDLGLGAKRLVDIARWCGGHDNASAIMLERIELRDGHGSTSGVDLCEVWDAFGEAQIMCARIEASSGVDVREPLSTPGQGQESQPSLSSHEAADALHSASGDNKPTKSKRERRAKDPKSQGSRKKPPTASASNTASEPKLRHKGKGEALELDLKIDFPDKP